MKSTKSQSSKTAAKSPAKKKSTSKSSSVAQGLRDLFEDELKDIYWAEKALTKAIPKMIKNATSEKLVSALTDHLEVTKGQVARCEKVFEILGKPARAKKCEAMAGLTKEAEEIMESTAEGVVRDAGIISAGQKVEHYEIASYGTLAAFAKVLEEKTCLQHLLKTLSEEKKCDELLTSIADTNLNSQAIK